MPVVTATCFTLPPWYTNTYSLDGAFILGLLSVASVCWSLLLLLLSLFFGAVCLLCSRVVTACIGTASACARLVLISTVAVNPGLNGLGLSAVFISRFW